MDADYFSFFDDMSAVPIQKTLKPIEVIATTYKTEPRIINNTRHEAIIPLQTEYDELQILHNYDYLKFNFELDTFQKLAISALHRDESVMVSAHTSSGKTVIAEYAIAMALKNDQRVIYTSPIKALSNQKYRELSAQFGSVGLITGDVTLNPNASCLVMTTEILRNMLYKGSEVMREVKWIVFDEIHYIKEKERGVVWEECIIMAPENIRMVFLSATVPNAAEFANWISEVRNSVIHVVYTEKRPTPLEHYIVPKGERMFKVLYEKEKEQSKASLESDHCMSATTYFDRKAFVNAMKTINGKQRINDRDVKKVLEIMIADDLLPTIVFSFSRKDCESYALSLTQDFLSEDEKKKSEEIFNCALTNLREEDRQLNLITTILPMLQRGIGIHHSGLLPIIKEIVEILFQEGLLKVLFATETFSIGLNMPARSVVFTNLTKFDGEERRLLSSGEYIQMSGRAGRRGIDKKGIVVSMFSDVINVKKGERLFSGLADKLTSAFRLSYNMILNLMRVESINVVNLMEKSLYHFQSKILGNEIYKQIEIMEKKANKFQERRKNIVRQNCKSYEHKRPKIAASPTSKVNDNFYFINPEQIQNDLLCIKTILLSNEFKERILAIEDIKKLHPLQIHNLLTVYEKIRMKRNELSCSYYNPHLTQGRVLDVFVPRNGSPYLLKKCMLRYANKKEINITAVVDGNMILKKYDAKYIDSIYDIRVKNLRSLNISNQKQIKTITIDNIIDDEIAMENDSLVVDVSKGKKKQKTKMTRDLVYEEIIFYNDHIVLLEELLRPYVNMCMFCGSHDESTDCLNNRCFDENDLENYFATSQDNNGHSHQLRRVFLEEKYFFELEKLKIKYGELCEIYHLDECRKMIQVLRRLEYCDETTVLTKGRVACEISTGDELLLTEMMFNGDFLSLPVEEVVPLLSCIVFPDWDNETTLSEKNNENYKFLKLMVEKITRVMKNSGIDVDEGTMIKKYSYELMDVVELWVRGYTFVEICSKTDVFEGTIIRCFKRLEELLKQMASAARSIGNTELENTFATGILKIKRDIVFANSLYL